MRKVYSANFSFRRHLKGIEHRKTVFLEEKVCPINSFKKHILKGLNLLGLLVSALFSFTLILLNI